MNYFLTGTDCGGEGPDFIQLSRVRLPKLKTGHKTVIDYTKLDRKTHSKAEVLCKVPHDGGEVLKARACPQKQSLIASLNTKGLINMYQISADYKGANVGTLVGLTQETFSLNWNSQSPNLICSGAGTTVCIWDINQHLKP